MGRRYRYTPDSAMFMGILMAIWIPMTALLLYLAIPYSATISMGAFFGMMLGPAVPAGIISYFVTDWYFNKRRPKAPPLQVGQGDGEYHAIPVPMQCRYCNTSMQPSSPMCPKCGRKN